MASTKGEIYFPCQRTIESLNHWYWHYKPKRVIYAIVDAAIVYWPQKTFVAYLLPISEVAQIVLLGFL